MDIKEILHYTTCMSYDVIDSLLEQLSAATSDEEKERLISHIAWHIPTGGPKMTMNGDPGKVLVKEEILNEIKSQYGMDETPAPEVVEEEELVVMSAPKPKKEKKAATKKETTVEETVAEVEVPEEVVAEVPDSSIEVEA